MMEPQNNDKEQLEGNEKTRQCRVIGSRQKTALKKRGECAMLPNIKPHKNWQCLFAGSLSVWFVWESPASCPKGAIPRSSLALSRVSHFG